MRAARGCGGGRFLPTQPLTPFPAPAGESRCPLRPGTGGDAGGGSAAPRGRLGGGGGGGEEGKSGPSEGARGTPWFAPAGDPLCRAGPPRGVCGGGAAGAGCKQKGLGRRAGSVSPPPLLLGSVDKALGAARTWAPLQGLKPPRFQKEKRSEVAFFLFVCFVLVR